MKVAATPIAGLSVVSNSRLADSRGSFARLFCREALTALVGDRVIQQINHSCTVEQGALRGMHFQHAPAAEMKLVRCVKGSVYDVAVDLRPGSDTFMHWHGIELSAENEDMFVIPEGFAHGFQALEPDCELLYLHTAAYAPEYEGGVRYDDPAFGIDWPLAITEISARDQSHALIDETFAGISL